MLFYHVGHIYGEISVFYNDYVWKWLEKFSVYEISVFYNCWCNAVLFTLPAGNEEEEGLAAVKKIRQEIGHRKGTSDRTLHSKHARTIFYENLSPFPGGILFRRFVVDMLSNAPGNRTWYTFCEPTRARKTTEVAGGRKIASAWQETGIKRLINAQAWRRTPFSGQTHCYADTIWMKASSYPRFTLPPPSAFFRLTDLLSVPRRATDFSKTRLESDTGTAFSA